MLNYIILKIPQTERTPLKTTQPDLKFLDNMTVVFHTP